MDRPRRYREQVEHLPKLAQMQVLAAKLCHERTLQQQLMDLIAQRTIDLSATGSDVTYTITVTNKGPGTAQSVVLTDNLPVSVTFVSCFSTGGGLGRSV